MKMRLNLAGVELLTKELNDKLSSNFITNVSVINTSDIVFSFSFLKEKTLLSLNHSSPFISLVNEIDNFSTTLGNLNDNLRKYFKGSYITKVEQINSDRIMRFSLVKNNEFFEKEFFYLVIELIPTINNLIILNNEETILFAKHYSDLTASRPIIKGMKYINIENNPMLVKNEFNYEEYKKEVSEYINELTLKTKKEKALPLYNFFKNRIKSLNKKVKVLKEEKETAISNLKYKEIAETLLTYNYVEEGREEYLESIKDTYKNDLTILQNSNLYFDRYKKCKRTIENDDREIEKAETEIAEFNRLLGVFEYLEEQELEELYSKYLPKKVNHRSNKKIDARMPYYIDYQGVKIGFGKNKEQNNYLTFKKANKDDIYLHAANIHGAHVVIFNKDPSEDVILLASEIALILSNETSGDIYIADIKDVKKGASLGEAHISNYQTITLHSIRESSKHLLKSQKRFSN